MTKLTKELFVRVTSKGLDGFWVDTVARDHFARVGSIEPDFITAQVLADFLRAAERERDHMIDRGYDGDAFDDWKAEQTPAPAPAPPVEQSYREIILEQIREAIEDAGPQRTSKYSDLQVLHILGLLCELIERTVP